eukprot:SAG31_NODE_4046_length_3639_cov_19.403390_6_plen_70_part_00
MSGRHHSGPVEQVPRTRASKVFRAQRRYGGAESTRAQCMRLLAVSGRAAPRCCGCGGHVASDAAPGCAC